MIDTDRIHAPAQRDAPHKQTDRLEAGDAVAEGRVPSVQRAVRSEAALRICVLSDLHLEFADFTPPPLECDVVVLAGDIHSAGRGLAWAREHFTWHPIVYVLGNHEFYGRRIEPFIDLVRLEAARRDIYFLEKDEAIIHGVRFLGTTLWTDFKLNGNSMQAVGRAMLDARLSLSDFSVIFYAGRLFRPTDSIVLHNESVDWLERKLAQPFAGRTVVVTHHLPHEKSVHAKYAGDRLNPCFASHLPNLVRRPVDLWIHGHTHSSCDYIVEGTRVVCNPRGYYPRELNPEFKDDFIVEL